MILQTRYNFIRNCNKFFNINHPFILEDGDTVLCEQVFINIFTEFFKKNPRNNIRIVVNFSDYVFEHYISKENYEYLINTVDVLVVGNTNLPDHPKLLKTFDFYCVDYLLENQERLRNIPKKDEVFYSCRLQSGPTNRIFLPRNINPFDYEIKDFIETMATYKYVYCPMSVLTTTRLYEAVACGCTLITSHGENFIKQFSNCQIINLPGISCGPYKHFVLEPYKIKTKFMKYNGSNDIYKLLEMPEDWRNFRISEEESKKMSSFVAESSSEYTHLFLAVDTWNKEITY